MNRRSARTAWRNRRTFSGLALLALAGGMLLTLPAQAQSSYRTNYRSSVTIDDSVLNALGPAPTLTDVLVPVRGPVGDLAPRPQSARRPVVTEASLLPPPDRAPHSSLTSIPRPAGTPRITPLATIPANAGSSTPSARPVARERNDANAAYRPPAAERVDPNAAYRPSQTVAYTPSPSPDPAATARVTPMASGPVAAPTVSNSQLAARAPTVAAMAAAADALPLPRGSDMVPAPAPTPASPPSAYRPSITAPAPMPATTEAPTQSASAALPPAAPVRGGNRLLFTSGSTDLTPAMQQELDQIVRQLGSSDNRRLRVVAYAEGNAETASQARRLSLQRALAVRNYLGERGIIGTRVLVEAQGNQAQGGPADRVDLQVVSGS